MEMLCRTVLSVFVICCLNQKVEGFGLGMGRLKYHGLPLGPVNLPPVNSTSRWADIFEDVLQPALDYCKSVRMCNTTGFFSFADSDCSECHPCSCDEACYTRGDCCIDKQLRDLGERFVLDPPDPAPSLTWGCHNTYLTHYDLAFHTFMVDTCGDNWKDREAVKRCLFPASHETFSLWPVWSRVTNTVYRNVDCARCNKESMDQVTRWNLKVACDRSVYLPHTGNVVEAMEKALEEPTCQILFVPPEICRPLPCKLVKGRYIDACNATGLRHSYDQTLWKACETFHGQMTLAGNTYKNVFCAMCNQDRVRIPGRCEMDPPFPFFLEMNGSSLNIQSHQNKSADRSCDCSDSEVYDKFEDQCRPLQCSMTRELHEGQCRSIVTNSSGVFYNLALSLIPADPNKAVQLRGTSSLTRVARNIRTAFLLQGSHTTGWHVMTHLFRVVAVTERVHSQPLGRESNSSQDLLHVIRFNVHIKFCSKWPEPSLALENRLFAMLKSTWNFSVDGRTKRSFKASPLYISEPKEVTKARTFQRVGLLSSEGSINEFAVDIPDSFIESHGGELLETNYYLPISEALKCARVSFNVSRDIEIGKVVLVVDQTSGTIHHFPSGKSVSFQFAEIGQDGEIFICANKLFENGIRDVKIDFPVQFVSTQLLEITVVLQALSEFVLLLVLMTYVVFSELRTMSGKNLLGLLITLIVAVALTGGSMFRVSMLGVCQVLGILAHFFLLSAFTWALICLFHSYHTLNSTSGSWLSRCLNEPRTLPKCTVVSVLVPAVIVAIIIISNAIESQDGCITNLGYGRGLCFVSAHNSLIVSVCLSLLVIFISIAVSIWTLWEQRGLSSSGSESFRQHVQQFLAQAFLTGLVPLAWFLQMMALLKNKEVLWYLSLVLFLGLAIYIFIVFVCKKQVLRLWYACFLSSFICGKGQRSGHKFSPVET